MKIPRDNRNAVNLGPLPLVLVGNVHQGPGVRNLLGLRIEDNVLAGTLFESEPHAESPPIGPTREVRTRGGAGGRSLVRPALVLAVLAEPVELGAIRRTASPCMRGLPVAADFADVAEVGGVSHQPRHHRMRWRDLSAHLLLQRQKNSTHLFLRQLYRHLCCTVCLWVVGNGALSRSRGQSLDPQAPQSFKGKSDHSGFIVAPDDDLAVPEPHNVVNDTLHSVWLGALAGHSVGEHALRGTVIDHEDLERGRSLFFWDFASAEDPIRGHEEVVHRDDWHAPRSELSVSRVTPLASEALDALVTPSAVGDVAELVRTQLRGGRQLR